VGDEAVRARHEQRGERRAHAALRGVALRFLVDAWAGPEDRRLHERLDLARRVTRGLARRVGAHQLLSALDVLVDEAHGERARHLACCVSTHPVGDDEELQLAIDEVVVLVVVANAPDVGPGV